MVGPTALSATPASVIAPPSIQTAAEAAAIAQSRAPLDLLVGAPGAGAHRQPDLGQQLAIADGRHVRPQVEVLNVDDALALSPGDHHLGPQRGADGAEVLGRVSLAQGAADGPAVAHHGVGDHLLGVSEDREPGREQL